MSTIDFSPTAYTVKSPGSGKIMRYESGMYPQMVGAAEREYMQLADEFPNLLSGGQQQRVAIIRAIATNPKLLLLDEVTSALDPVLIAEVLTLISELKRDGMTMVIATHEMGFAKKIADSVVFLHKGRVHESGKPERIFESPKTQELKNFLGALHQAGRL